MTSMALPRRPVTKASLPPSYRGGSLGSERVSNVPVSPHLDGLKSSPERASETSAVLPPGLRTGERAWAPDADQNPGGHALSLCEMERAECRKRILPSSALCLVVTVRRKRGEEEEHRGQQEGRRKAPLP